MNAEEIEQLFAPKIATEEHRYGFPEGFFHEMLRKESHFRQDIVFEEKASNAGAKGIAQTLYRTAKSFAKDLGIAEKDMYLPENNIKIGAAYLNWLVKYFKKNPDPKVGQNAYTLAKASYNAGQNSSSIHEAISLIKQGKDFTQVLPKETQNYLEPDKTAVANRTKEIDPLTHPGTDSNQVPTTKAFFNQFAPLMPVLQQLNALPKPKIEQMGKFLKAVGKGKIISIK